MKSTKTRLRSRTQDEWLNILVVINIYNNITQKLNIEDIIDEFSKLKRQLNFMN